MKEIKKQWPWKDCKKKHLYIWGELNSGKTAFVIWLRHAKEWPIFEMSNTPESSTDYSGEPILWIEEAEYEKNVWSITKINRLCEGRPIKVNYAKLKPSKNHWIIITSNQSPEEFIGDRKIGKDSAVSLFKARFNCLSTQEAMSAFNTNLKECAAAYKLAEKLSDDSDNSEDSDEESKMPVPLPKPNTPFSKFPLLFKRNCKICKAEISKGELCILH